MKKVFLLLAAAGIFTACSQTEEVASSFENSQPKAIGFDTYVNRGVTRSETNLTSLETSGFGVFAFNTGTTAYADATDRTANFMFNEHVTKSSDNWTYSPVKYWPNDGSKLTFIAYAPYASDATPTSYTNTITGNPVIKIANATTDYVIAKVENLTKSSNEAKIDGKVSFTFEHVFSKIEKITIRQLVDEVLTASKVSTNEAASETTVKVTELKLHGATAAKADATLDLYTKVLTGGDTGDNNSDISLLTRTGDNLKVKKGYTGADDFIETPSLSVLANTETEGDPAVAKVKLKLGYTVETTDDKLASGKATTTHNVELPLPINASTKYTINIVIGLTSVKFDVNQVNALTDQSTEEEIVIKNHN